MRKLDPGCLSGAYCCVVVTEWERFKALTPDNSTDFDLRQFRHRLAFSAVGLGGGESFDGVHTRAVTSNTAHRTA
jgi:hypothetical protein